MKGLRLIVFLSVFFVLYFLLNFYIYNQAIGALEHLASDLTIRIFIGFFYLMVFSYPFARILGKRIPLKIADFFALIGGMWFAAMLYLILLLLTIDLGNLILSFIPAVQNVLSENSVIVNITIFITVSIIVLILLIAGYLNASNPQIKELEINIDKSPPNLKSLHMVFASDIHLGHIIGKKNLGRIIDRINTLDPDLVLFPGDLVDEELKPVIDKNLGEYFKTLQPKFGIYAVPGNHEYIGGVEQAIKYLSKFGIRFLRDSVVDVNGLFYIAGRDDISITNFYGIARKPLKELLGNVNPDLPVILMDHQPIALSEAAEANVDLQISGHTHHGQMWPLHAITNSVFKLSRGYRKINGSHFYVSSGAGTWGPRVRIGNRPEIVSVRIIFRDKPKVSQNEQMEGEFFTN